MAEPPAALTLADQVLVNALAALCVAVVHDAGRERMLIEVLAEVLPATTPGHPQLEPLRAAAEQFLNNPVIELPREAAARLRAAEPLAAFFTARAGLALEAFRAGQAPRGVAHG